MPLLLVLSLQLLPINRTSAPYAAAMQVFTFAQQL